MSRWASKARLVLLPLLLMATSCLGAPSGSNNPDPDPTGATEVFLSNMNSCSESARRVHSDPNAELNHFLTCLKRRTDEQARQKCDMGQICARGYF